MGMICNSYSINLCFAHGKIVSTESGVENEARVWFSDRRIQEADVESFESIKSMIEDKILIFGCNLLSDDGSRFDNGFGDEDEYEDEEDDNVYKEEWERYWASVLKYDYSDLCGVILMTLNDVVEGVNRIDYIFIHVKPSFKTISGSKDQSFVKDASGRGSFVPDLSSFCRELIKDLPEESEKTLKDKTTANKSSKTSAKTTTAAKTESSKNVSTATKKKSAAPMSFNASQFKGIHKVTKAPERVWVGNLWSIEVPVGFSYTADPEKSGDILGIFNYQLNIQNSKDCNFDIPFTSVINVVVDAELNFADLNCDDISDETFIQSLDALSDDYQIHKCSRDLVVLYKVSKESNEYSSCEFQVVTRGNNAIFSGRFACKEGTIDERKKNILHWLDTIDVLTQDEIISFTDYSGKSEIKIPTEYGEEMAPIDPGIRISVPQGFHAETNQAIIGNGLKLAIVPENYSFSDYLLDAPVVLLVQSSVMKNTPTRADLLNDYFIQMCNQGKFKDVYAASVYKNSEKAFTITQIYSGGGMPKSSSVSMLFANNEVYTVFIIISYTEESFDRNIGLWDVEHLANAWLARIQVDGKTVPDYSSPSSSSTVKKNAKKKDSPKATKKSAEDTSTSPQAGAEDPIAGLEVRADSWMQKYGEYIDHDPEIDFDGSLFVFSGFGVLGKDDPTVLDVIEKGGQYRSKVSGLTNYLVVNPRLAGDSQIVAVIEQLQKGKNIKVILLEDLEKALEGKTTAKKSSTTSAKNTAAKKTTSKSTSTKSTTKTDSTKSKRGSSSSGNNSTGTSKSNEIYVIDDTTGELTEYKGKETDIVLPNGIKIIGRSAFEYGEITSVVIPEGVEEIDDCAFSECKNLKSVKLPNTIKKIGVDAFSMCEQLTSIIIPDGVETIGDSAFFECKNLRSLELPNTFKIIGRSTFGSCEQLTSIIIPDGVETIDFSAFSNCKTLKSVTLPNTIKTIGKFAFELCEQLTSIVIPDGVETIDDYAFSECKKLKDIYVPDSVHFIGKYAFDTENEDTIVHTVRGSRADIVAQEYCKVDYRYPSSSISSSASFKTTYTPASSSRANATSSNSVNYSTSKGTEHPKKVLTNEPITLTAKEREELKSYFPDNIMGAIKYVMELKNLEFSEAKLFVDGFEKSLNEKPVNTPRSNSTSAAPVSNSTNTNSGGCYVATAVYGSYDCPEVWTLRRYRDYTLAETWYGRAFIKAYYAISPTLVKWFGHTKWFKTMWRGKLDRMVSNLKKQGVESSPYQDRNW